MSVSRISSKLIIFLILVALIPLIVYGGLSIFTARRIYYQSAAEANMRIVTRAAEHIKLYIFNSLDILQGMVQNMKNLNLTRDELNVLVNNYVLNFSQFRKIYLTDHQGGEIAASGVGSELNLNDSSREGFRSAMQGKNYISKVYISDDFCPYLILALPIKQLNKITGVLIGQLDLVNMWELVDNLKISQESYAWVISQSGLLIAHGDSRQKAAVIREEQWNDLPIASSALKGKSGTSIYRNRLCEKVLGVSHPIDSLGWAIVLEEPTRNAYYLANLMSWRLLGLTLVFLGLVIILGLKGRQAILKPIYEFMFATRELAEGNFLYRIKIQSNDEFKKLGEAFNNMAEQLHKLKEEIKLNERLAIFSRIAAGLVHDLKHPIKCIENASILMNRDDDPESKKIFASVVNRELENINRFLQDLHSLTHSVSKKQATLELKTWLEEILTSYRPNFEESKLNLCTSFGNPGLRLYTDPFLLERAIKNLITNAIEAMSIGGTISLGFQEKSGPIPKPRVEIIISDTGTGISEEQLATLFSDFTTTKRRGLGLGLALTKKYIEELGGSITVESRLNGGTTFVLSLPI